MSAQPPTPAITPANKPTANAGQTCSICGKPYFGSSCFRCSNDTPLRPIAVMTLAAMPAYIAAHRDDTGPIVLPRPGVPGRVTPSVIRTAKSTLATAQQRLAAGRLNSQRAWVLTHRAAGAKAALIAAGGVR